jgi:hypothetical protein
MIELIYSIISAGDESASYAKVTSKGKDMSF